MRAHLTLPISACSLIMKRYKPMRRPRKIRGSEFWLPLLGLFAVFALLALVIWNPVARLRAGGPWTVLGLSLTSGLLIYLHPEVQGFLQLRRRARLRRDQHRLEEVRRQQRMEQAHLDRIKRGKQDGPR